MTLTPSLAGLEVVIARSEPAMATTVEAFEARGARVTAAVTATHTPASDGGAALVAALERPPAGWLAVASAAAVASLSGLAADLRPWRVAVIGSSTADRAAAAGLRVELVARTTTGAGLVEMLEDRTVDRLVAPVVENEPSALAGAIVGSALAERSEIIAAYRSEPKDLSRFADRIADAHLVVAFAPSGVRRLAEVGRPRHLVAIGPTTAAPAIEWLGSPRVSVAERHDLAGVLEQVERWWAVGNDLGSAS